MRTPLRVSLVAASAVFCATLLVFVFHHDRINGHVLTPLEEAPSARVTAMRRSSYDNLVLNTPGLRPLLHACSGCGRFGLKPGILEAHYGNYGWREAGRKYAELALDGRGLCEHCATEP
jgi:hypothetical protein